MKTTWKWIPVLALAAAAAYAQADFPGEAPDGEAPPPPSFCEKAGCPGMDRPMPPPCGKCCPCGPCARMEKPRCAPDGECPCPPPDACKGPTEGERAPSCCEKACCPGMARPMPPPCGNRGPCGPCGRMEKLRCAPDCDRPCPPPDCGKGPTEEERAEFAAFRKLCKDVCAETDEAKKAEMAETLRAKLGEMADRQHERLQARLAAAEKRIEEQKARLDRQLADLKAMIEEGEANRDEWIEEQCRCILSGERPPMRPHRRGECGGPKGGRHRGPHGHGRGDMPQPQEVEGAPEME